MKLIERGASLSEISILALSNRTLMKIETEIEKYNLKNPERKIFY